MSIKQGSIVKAVAGRDRDRFFVVLKTEGRFAYIADGKTRKIDKPKRKKLIHLAKTDYTAEGSYETNPQLKKILYQFNNGG